MLRRAFVFALGAVAALSLLPRPALADDQCTDNVSNSNYPQPLDSITVVGDPIYPSPRDTKNVPLTGNGMCGAFRYAGDMPPFKDPPLDVKSSPNIVPDSINAFMDDPIGVARVDQTLSSPFDLSNDVNDNGENSFGDYTATPECKPAMPSDPNRWPGCAFPGSQGMNIRSGFGTRYRGFINVEQAWVGQPLHLGFYSDDIVGVRIFWKKRGTDPKQPPEYDFKWLISRGTAAGSNKFISTNKVVFPTEGLYVLEIVHGSYGGAAILEFGILINNAYQDRDQKPLAVTGRIELDSASCNFDIARTKPTRFFQAGCGPFAYPGANGACQQCPDSYRDKDRIMGSPYPCADAYFCNAATVCAPCVEDRHCGTECRTCGVKTPRCKSDPADPCNPAKANCCECVSNKDCAAGQICADNCQCVAPPCCPGYFSVYPDKVNDPNYRLCSPCQTDADCQAKGLGSICDLKNARCTDKAAPDCPTPVDEHCGAACNINCRTQTPGRPYCLNNQVCVACRRDADCSAGNFCLSGTCTPCTEDRHCGPSCQRCGTSLVIDNGAAEPRSQPTATPFCIVDKDKNVANAYCAQCRSDSDCGDGHTCSGGTCSPVTACDPACQPGEICFGNKCVQCFADSQCPCGSCIDGKCSDKCATNQDCEGNQCCQKTTGACVSGRCGGTAGGALCGCSLAASPASPNLEPEPFEPLSSEGARSRGLMLAGLTALLCGLALRRRMRRAQPVDASARWS